MRSRASRCSVGEVVWSLAVAMFAAGCAPRLDCAPTFQSDDEALRELGTLRLRRTVIDAETCGPAYAAAGDVDGDGATDLVISALGPAPEGKVPPGSVHAYLQRAGAFTRAPLLAPEEGVRFPNRPTLADLDGDGDLDVVQPLGFFPCSFELFGTPCGGLLRFDNDGSGHFARTDVVRPGARTFHHGIELGDLDGDGTRDLVTIGERRGAPWEPGETELLWMRGEGEGRFGAAEARGVGLSTFPSLGDVDGDGDVDVAGGEFLGAKRASYAWMENRGAGDFIRHVISDHHGPGFGLQLVPDLLGDGRLVAVGTNHTNPVRRPEEPAAAVVLLTPGEDPTAPWTEQVLLDGFVPENRAGQFSPGLLGVGDLDGDGRLDLVVSGDGDPRVFVLLQRVQGTFEPHVLEDGLGQAGGMLIVDLDRDGVNELVVTGYEDHVTFVYRRE